MLRQKIKEAKLQQSTIGSRSVGIHKNANTDVCRSLSKDIFKEGHNRGRKKMTAPLFFIAMIRTTYRLQWYTNFHQSPCLHFHANLSLFFSFLSLMMKRKRKKTYTTKVGCCYLTYTDTARQVCYKMLSCSAYVNFCWYSALVVHCQSNFGHNRFIFLVVVVVV